MFWRLRLRYQLVFAGSLIALVAVWGGPRVASGYPSQFSTALCSLLPKGAMIGVSFEVTVSTIDGSPRAQCEGNFPLGPNGRIYNIEVYDTAALAKQRVATDFTADRASTYQPISGLGDSAMQYLKTGFTAGEIATEALVFSRSCFAALVESEPRDVKVDQAEDLRQAQTLDAQLVANTKKYCQPAAPTAATVATANLTAGLACDQKDLQANGGLTCAASALGQGPNAALTYAWTVDGKPQSATGQALDLSGLSQGSHTIGVRVRDTRANQSADAPPLTVTRAAAGQNTGGGQPGGSGGSTNSSGNASSNSSQRPPAAPILGVPGGTNGAKTGGSNVPVPIIVTGGALVAAAAIGALIALGGRNRGQRPPATAGGPGIAGASPSPGPAPAAGPVPWPAVPTPATSASNDRPRDRDSQPHVSVRLLVQPSVRTRDRFGPEDPHIWGDSVDVAFVGYELSVSPPDWQVANLDEERLSAPGGTSPRVEEFAGVGGRGLGSGLSVPSPERRWVLMADWVSVDTSLPLSLLVHGTVRNQAGRSWPFTSVATATVSVVGAKPTLQLRPSGDGDADGSCVVRIDPVLTLFDTVYPGGLEIGEFLGYPSDLADLRSYFEIRTDDYGSQTPFYQQGANLRCKFRLRDEQFVLIGDTGVLVRFSVRPTGVGLGQSVVRDDFDWMPAAHYAVCRDRLVSIEPASPAAVRLRPSTIELERPAPDQLPAPSSRSERLYRARFRAVTRSATGRPVPGGDIRKDRQSLAGWWLTFHYDVPGNPRLAAWDPGKTPAQRTSSKVFAEDVDDRGYLMFAPQGGGPLQPWYDYDHWAAFYDAQSRYLAGQGCTLRATVHADTQQFDGPPLFIGPPCKVYIYVNDGRDGPSGHGFAGLIDERGRELRPGYSQYQVLRLPDSATGGEPVSGVLIGSLGGAMLGAAASAYIALYLIPGAGLAIGAVKLITVVGGMAAGMAAGLELSVGQGMLTDDSDQHFDWCRGWDISREEYQRLFQRIQKWKKRCDEHDSLYDVRGIEADGNCVSFAYDVLNTAGIPSPYARAYDLSRPGNLTDALVNDPRAEPNPQRSAAAFKHPWVYGAGVVPGKLPWAELGSWPPPKLPVSAPSASSRSPRAGVAEPPRVARPPDEPGFYRPPSGRGMKP